MRSTVLASVAPFLPPKDSSEVLDEALAAARGLQDYPTIVMSLAELLPEIEEPEQSRVLESMIRLIRAVLEPNDRAYLITRLLPQLSGSETSLALTEDALQALGDVARTRSNVDSADIDPENRADRALATVLGRPCY